MAEWVKDKSGTWNLHLKGVHVWIAERPPYCDRGHYVGNVNGIATIDAQDAFPRYYMNFERAQAELYEWLLWRLLRENEDNQRFAPGKSSSQSTEGSKDEN